MKTNYFTFHRIAIIAIMQMLLMGIHAQYYTSAIETSDSSGFYRIQLPPDGIALMSGDYRDLRIINQQGKEVAYLPVNDDSRLFTSALHEFPIVSHEILKDSATILILDNSSRQKTDNLSLMIGNAGVEKQIRLTGSNDRRIWYSVRENAVFSAVNNPNDVAEFKLIDFPLTNYRWFRIEIDDRRTSPVNVIKAGVRKYANVKPMPDYLPIDCSFTTDDSIRQKTTWVDIPFHRPMVADKIEIIVDSPKFFLRDVDVYGMQNDSAGHTDKRWLMSAVFRSDEPIVLFPGSYKGNGITLAIHNKDNQPLSIPSVSCFQKQRYCLAWMEKGDSCHFTYGQKGMKLPDYDIQFFKNQAETQLTTLKAAQSQYVAPLSQATNQPLPFFKDPRFIWLAIIIVIGLLGYFTYTLMKEKTNEPF